MAERKREPTPEAPPGPDEPARAPVTPAPRPGQPDPPPEELIPANQAPWLRQVIASLHQRITILEDELQAVAGLHDKVSSLERELRKRASSSPGTSSGKG